MATRAARTSPSVTVAVMTTAVIGVNTLFGGCGRGSPTGPSPTNPERLTVTITDDGLSPATLKVPLCTYSAGLTAAIAPCHFVVAFVNSGSGPADVRSDPHPAHTACPDVNLEVIAPGQSQVTRDLFGCFTTAAWRTYHDETRPDDPRFWGRIEW